MGFRQGFLGGALAAAITLSPAALAPAFADILWKMEHKTGDGAPETTEIWANEENIRMRVVGADGAGDTEAILLGDRQEMIMIDHGRREYFVMQAGAMAEQMGAMKTQLDSAMAAAMAGLDPEARRAAEAAMGRAGLDMGAAAGSGFPGMAQAPSYAVEKTEESKKIFGTRAEKYVILKNGAPDGEVWAARAGAVKGGAVVRDRMKDLRTFMETAMGDFFRGEADPFLIFDEMDNLVAVASVVSGPAGASVETRLVSAEDKDAPAGAWAPPDGYAKAETPFDE